MVDIDKQFIFRFGPPLDNNRFSVQIIPSRMHTLRSYSVDGLNEQEMDFIDNLTGHIGLEEISPNLVYSFSKISPSKVEIIDLLQSHLIHHDAAFEQEIIDKMKAARNKSRSKSKGAVKKPLIRVIGFIDDGLNGYSGKVQ
jgi:hypothetical protein